MKNLAVLAVLMSTISGVAQTPAAPPPTQPGMTLTSPAFEDGGVIPNKYTSAAENGATPVSPKLTWSHVPDGVVSFALLVRDPDTTMNKNPTEFVHWMVINIPGTARELPEAIPAQATLPDGSIQAALTQRKRVGYMGMGARAPGPYHHYTFELFALDTKLSLGPDFTEADLLKAMEGHVLAKAAMVGRYHHP